MRWLAVMGVSITVHAVVIVALPRGDQAAVPPEVTPVVTLEPLPAPVPAMDIVPMDVIVLPSSAGPATAPAGVRQATARVASSRAGSASVTTPATAPEPPASNAFRMRFPDADPPAPRRAAVDLAVPGSVIAAIIDKPSPELPAKGGELVPNEDGTYTKRDVAYVATINADGTVQLTDRPNFHASLKLPSIRALKNHLAKWVEDPYGDTIGDVDEGASSDDDDDVWIIPVIVGGFDVTDAFERLAGNDPYYAKKLAFLDRTRDERVEIGRKYRAVQLEHAEAYALANADALWESADVSIADKRALLFELWDECAETGSDELVDAGNRARAALLRFIAVHLPAGSDDAYTADEVKRLDARRHSRAHFAPY